MRKVPRGAEACNIQAATLEAFPSPVVVFARLREAIILEDFCEISAPTRFLCLVLGPPGSEEKVNEMGRALGTIMSDQVRRKRREENLSSISHAP